ncbi:hypothetical protein C0J09_02585 [Bordetella avium]|nr:hypothetical protein C0J09_02585 [Bordetella avium]
MIGLNRPGFPRHPVASQLRRYGGVYGRQVIAAAILRRVQGAAVKQAGHRVGDVATRLGVSTHSLYAWLKRYSGSAEQSAEVRRLKAALKRVSEEHDILKKAAAYFAKQSGCGTRLSRPMKSNALCAVLWGCIPAASHGRIAFLLPAIGKKGGVTRQRAGALQVLR